MSQIDEVLSTQKSLERRFSPLEEMFAEGMEAVQAQIDAAGPGKDTIATVAEEFRTFRVIMYKLLGLLRRDITECSWQIDEIRTRSRRKALIFQGIPEKEGENCKSIAIDVTNTKMGLNLTTSSIKVCHRLGQSNTDHHRPLLVRFASVKSSVWRAKTRLRGTEIAIKEFLTKERQAVFVKARQHFGMRSCWTQDGVIYIKVSDGSKCRVTSMGELKPLLTKYPRLHSKSSTGAKQDADGGGNLKGARR
ncbi:uncharacterized protein LOC111357627 [Spodoptera litura]|uniref:Uncharacterized protein LOC111357627 n=1 Tax=Spodoptera litura TaxID=69820 RepID=A0A9J7EGR3_SPOLT|nr:uncharacterized protein LOC111357627 [Spodoptera litura]